MRLSIFLLMLFINLFSFQSNVYAKITDMKVFVKDGNIYYRSSEGQIVKLTVKGKDQTPILSPDKRLVAFIRKSDRIVPKECILVDDTGTRYGNEIWLYDFERKTERLLVANNFNCNALEQQITDPSNLQFSPDSNTVYFVASAWVTTGAVHGVNINGKNLRYILPGNSLEVVPKGDYKGYLIVNQHRYFIGGGSFDWFWVFTPEGKEEGPIGPEIQQFQRDFLETKT